jgi:hypothetical protein
VKNARLKLRSYVRLEADAEGKGGMMLDTQSGTICACNESAWISLKAMKKGIDAEALAVGLTKIFDVDPDAASKDILALVSELHLMDLLEQT